MAVPRGVQVHVTHTRRKARLFNLRTPSEWLLRGL